MPFIFIFCFSIIPNIIINDKVMKCNAISHGSVTYPSINQPIGRNFYLHSLNNKLYLFPFKKYSYLFEKFGKQKKLEKLEKFIHTLKCPRKSILKIVYFLYIFV